MPVGEQKILSREERVEYRDQDGNLLDEEQVKALQGKVEFKTRYETRTRIVDANGNEVPPPAGGEQQVPVNPDGAIDGASLAASPEGVAPPHPDIEGAEPETKRLNPDELSPPLRRAWRVRRRTRRRAPSRQARATRPLPSRHRLKLPRLVPCMCGRIRIGCPSVHRLLYVVRSILTVGRLARIDKLFMVTSFLRAKTAE